MALETKQTITSLQQSIPAIAGIDDPAQARMVLYQAGRPVHAPMDRVGLLTVADAADLTTGYLTVADAAATYQPISLTGSHKISSGTAGSSVATIDFTIPTTGYTSFELLITDADINTAGGSSVGIRFSWNGGSTFPAAANQYLYAIVVIHATSTAVSGAGWTGNGGPTDAIYPNSYMFGGGWTRAISRTWFPLCRGADYISVHSTGSAYYTTSIAYERGFFASNIDAGPPNAGQIVGWGGTLKAGLNWQLNGFK